MQSVLAAPAQHLTAAKPARTFTGTLPDPVLGGLYRYNEIRDAPPSIGPARRPNPVDHEVAGAMADWITKTPHDRPFWRYPGFVAEFGRATRAELRAAVDEMWRRAEDAARVARMPTTWTATLPSNDEKERN